MQTGANYELLARKLIDSLQASGQLAEYEGGSGPRNRMAGASGYKHQIDLSLQSEKALFLLELKYLGKPVGVAELLILASRKADLEARFAPTPVHASLVTTMKPSRNVRPLAAHFGVNIDFVADLSSYALTFDLNRFLGHVESAQAADIVSASFIPANGA